MRWVGVSCVLGAGRRLPCSCCPSYAEEGLQADLDISFLMFAVTFSSGASLHRSLLTGRATGSSGSACPDYQVRLMSETYLGIPMFFSCK